MECGLPFKPSMDKTSCLVALCLMALAPYQALAQSCDPGNYLNGVSCNFCRADTYQPNADYSGMSCTQCPTGSTTGTGFSALGKTSVDDCKCPVNTYMKNNACNPCFPFSSTKGGTGWRNCACDTPGYYRDGNNEVCLPCGADTIGSYSSGTHFGFCHCAAGYYNGYNNLYQRYESICHQCPQYSTSASTSSFPTDCICEPGRYLLGGDGSGVPIGTETCETCQSCNEGFFIAACSGPGTEGRSCLPCTNNCSTGETVLAQCTGSSSTMDYVCGPQPVPSPLPPNEPNEPPLVVPTTTPLPDSSTAPFLHAPITLVVVTLTLVLGALSNKGVSLTFEQ